MKAVFPMLVAIFALSPSLSWAQQEPAPKDDSPYAQAYRLLFPEEDMRERAQKAIGLLTESRKIDRLTAGELALLCRAYNELGQPRDQYEAAKLLWKKSPGSDDATRWITNSLYSLYIFRGNTQPIIDFVDAEIKNAKGHERELLVLKAQAIIKQRNGLTDDEKREQATALITEAYTYDPAWPEGIPKGGRIIDSPNFIDFDQVLCEFFRRETGTGPVLDVLVHSQIA